MDEDRLSTLRLSLQSEVRQLFGLLAMRGRLSVGQAREGTKQASDSDPLVKLRELTPEEAALSINQQVRERGPAHARAIEALARELAELLESADEA